MGGGRTSIGRAITGAGWRNIRMAVSFLTIVPLAPPLPSSEASGQGYLSPAMPMFPVVGAGIGVLAGLVLLAGSALGLPPLAAASLAVVSGVLITGALHEDGLGDVADGFGGGRTREDKLRIMKDSRVGTFGVVAIASSLMLRAAALAGLPAIAAMTALIAAGALSRACLPALMRWLPPARTQGMAAEAGSPCTWHAVAAVAVAAVIALVALGPAAGIAAIIATTAGIVVTGFLAHRQIDGHTGDVCGAAQQAAEVAVLLTVAALR